jgi:hypothetical protein
MMHAMPVFRALPEALACGATPIHHGVRVVVPEWPAVSVSDVFATGRAAVRQRRVVRIARGLVPDPLRAPALAFSPRPL